MEVLKSARDGRIKFLNFSQRVAITDVDVGRRIKSKFELADSPDDVSAAWVWPEVRCLPACEHRWPCVLTAGPGGMFLQARTGALD